MLMVHVAGVPANSTGVLDYFSTMSSPLYSFCNLSRSCPLIASMNPYLRIVVKRYDWIWNSAHPSRQFDSSCASLDSYCQCWRLRDGNETELERKTKTKVSRVTGFYLPTGFSMVAG